jgi:predicted amidohydrolase
MVNHAAPRMNGHSFAVDYDGNIVQELEAPEGILLVEFDLDQLDAHRAKGIYGLHHRRPEMYGLLTDPAGQIHPPGVNLPPGSAWRAP